MIGLVSSAKIFLRDPQLFSNLVIRFPLYNYQLVPLKAIIKSILFKQGHEFLLIFPRQSGKNETIAQLLVYLLNLFQRTGGQIVYGATGDGIGRGLSRLEERLDNDWNKKNWEKKNKPTRRVLGNAAVAFLSTHPGAATRGETAHILLAIDEFQDQSLNHIESVFEPMRAAFNTTAVFFGTAKTTSDALWQKKQQLEMLEKDGTKRVFLVSPEEVIEENLDYGAFLKAKLAKFGRNHPIISSEYFNEPIDADGGLFSNRRLQLMFGQHNREEKPNSGRNYVASIDIGGQDEGATDPVAQLDSPGRDYTVATVFEISKPLGASMPHYKAVDVFLDHGSHHFTPAAGRPSLAAQLLAWLQHWNVSYVVIDSTGIGAGLTDWLRPYFNDRVTGYLFTKRSKAQLGSSFISVIETGRFHYWQSEKLFDDSWWFRVQAENCSYYLPPNGVFDHDLQWAVPPSARVDAGAGRKPIHDDRLLSAALVSYFDILYNKGVLFLGEAVSQIVAPIDPLSDLSW